MSEGLSKGQVLLHDKKLKQASCFFVSSVSIEKRLEWSDSLVNPRFRNDQTKLKDSSIFLVLSQNCDIACRNDMLESTIELAVCKKIRAKDVHPGNSFVKSVRKLHFQAQDNWYEANVDYILTVDKADLLENINLIADFGPIYLSDEYAKSVPVWRSNRYMRSALPDHFNNQLFPVIGRHIDKIEAIAKSEVGTPYSSYVRAFYLWVDSNEEKETYSFDLFALLRDETSDKKTSEILDAVEEMAEDLADSSNFYDESNIYAGRESTTTVAYLTKFIRLNLDHHSLSQGDSDIGSEEL